MNIFVTGVSRGIGNALCVALAERGHCIWGISRAKESPFDDKRIQYSYADVRSQESLDRVYQEMQSADFLPDTVILNASILHEDKNDGYDTAAGEETIEINVNGALRCVGLFLPRLLERGRGSFIAVASTSACRPSHRSPSYAASKAAIAMAFRSFRLRFGRRGLAFKIAFLGPVATDMWEGNVSRLVPSPQNAALALAKFCENNRLTLWYPRMSTSLLRMACWMPDTLFERISSALLR